MTKPKVLISDALSPAAVQIFRDRGVEVDFQPNLGKDKDKLAEIIGNYDGLAIPALRSAQPPRRPRRSSTRPPG
jgi:D-3-phosphoglycerate dehydrogenase / 2-oxoglutarate reductase